MELVTFESETFKAIENMISNTLNKVGTIEGALKTIGDDRVMSMEQAMEYTGIGRTKLGEYKAEIGFIQIGCGPIKFRKSQIDAFLEKHTHKANSKSNERHRKIRN